MSSGNDSDKGVIQEVYVGKRKLRWYHFPSQDENTEAIRRLTTGYHRFKLLRLSSVDDENQDWDHNTLLALQQNYFEILEFALSLSFAAIQGVSAIPLWMTEYRNSDLDYLVDICATGAKIPSTLGNSLSDLLDEMVEGRDIERGALEDLFKNMIADHKRTHYLEAYNATKHGSRAIPSDFNLLTSKAHFKIKCGIVFWRSQELYKHEVDIPGDVKKAFYLEQSIVTVSDLNIFAQNMVCLSWLDILIDTLRSVAGVDQKDMALKFPSQQEVARAWHYPNGHGTIVITPEIHINGRKRTANSYKDSPESEGFCDISI